MAKKIPIARGRKCEDKTKRTKVILLSFRTKNALRIQGEEFDWLFVRLAMSPSVGDRVHPLARGGIEYIQAMRQFQSVEEIFLYVPGEDVLGGNVTFNF
jgi:hypothetical protein